MKTSKMLTIIVVALGLINCGGQTAFAGSIIGWGLNSSDQATPPNGNDFVAIAAGFAHNVALKSDGSLVGWGRNIAGEADPPAGNDFVAVAAGFYFGLALKSDGSIVGWGGSSGASTPPGNDFVAIAGGYRFGLGLKSDGSIAGWGLNDYGQADPCEGNDYVAIAAGASHGLALKADGSVIGWGRNDNGEINVPVGNDFIAIATFHSFSAALKSDGSVIQWGAPQDPPPAGNDYAAVAVGIGHGLAIMSDGSLLGWGQNDSNEATPPDGTDFVAVAAGVHYGLALTQSLVSTRFTYQGQLLNDGTAADGLYDFEFKIFRDPVIKVQEGKTLSLENIDVIDGQFTVELDFGNDANVFAGKERWLEVAVRPGDSNDANDFVVLSPRQEVTSTPHAQVAYTALGLRVAGTETHAVYVDPNGNVGIGTMSPAAKLDVAGNIKTTGLYEDTAGNVGIGTENPEEKLEVNGKLRLTGSTYSTMLSDEGGALMIDTSRLATSAQVRILPYDNDIWLQNTNSAGDICFSGYAGEDLTGDINLKTAGNVGIGTASPTQKLDVTGNVIASGYYDRDNPSYYVDPTSSGTSANFNGNVYATLYYDRNNTGYYVDPAGTSHVNTLYAFIFYDKSNSSYYMDPSSSGTSANFAGNVYASQYYDRNNTAYYADPASTSYLYSLNVQSSLNVQGAVDMDNINDYSTCGDYVHISSSGRLGVCLSSKRYKENITPLKDDFSKILEAQPVAFTFKKSKEPGIGFIAEDLDELGLRNLVTYDTQGRPRSIRYELTSLYLLEILKDQAKSIEELKEQNESLKEQLKVENQSLKERLGALERTVQQIAKAKEVKI